MSILFKKFLNIIIIFTIFCIFCPSAENSVDFNGDSDSINCGDIDAIDSATTFSGSCWIYHDLINNDDSIIAKSNAFNDGFVLFRDNVSASSSNSNVVFFNTIVFSLLCIWLHIHNKLFSVIRQFFIYFTILD